jgi:hypothetical protein
MRRQHRAGEALEVDYAGMTLSVIDKGVVRQAHRQLVSRTDFVPNASEMMVTAA